jgi:hypothetical protein
MTARKTFLIATVTALASLPAWAVSSQASSGKSQGHGQATAPGQLKDADEHSGTHGNSGTHGKSHKCKPHGVAYILTGVLETQALSLNSDGTYSGSVTLEKVTHSNHHAKLNKELKFELTNVHVTFGLADTNSDGSVGLDDLAKGDTVKLIGKVPVTAKKCGIAPGTPKFRKALFTAPASS